MMLQCHLGLLLCQVLDDAKDLFQDDSLTWLLVQFFIGTWQLFSPEQAIQERVT